MNAITWLRRVFITVPMSIFWLLLFWITGMIAKWFGSEGHGAAGFYARLLLRTAGVRVTVSGAKLPAGRACVLVANHMSLADTPLLMGFLPSNFRFIAKASLFKTPIIGWHLRRGGHIGVVREDARSAVKSLAEAAKKIERGVSVLLFAEGSRSYGEMRDFKGGAAHLAIKTAAPVVPIAIQGTDEVLPRNAVIIRAARVHLRVGDAIETAAMNPAERASLTARLQEEVKGLLTALDGSGRQAPAPAPDGRPAAEPPES
jgi:1-acyl-sn-glycerol-3-phosphate acyltransferase